MGTGFTRRGTRRSNGSKPRREGQRLGGLARGAAAQGVGDLFGVVSPFLLTKSASRRGSAQERRARPHFSSHPGAGQRRPGPALHNGRSRPRVLSPDRSVEPGDMSAKPHGSRPGAWVPTLYVAMGIPFAMVIWV